MSDLSEQLEIRLAGARLNPQPSNALPQNYYGDPSKVVKLRCEESCGPCVYSRQGKAGHFCGRGKEYGTRCNIFKKGKKNGD